MLTQKIISTKLVGQRLKPVVALLCALTFGVISMLYYMQIQHTDFFFTRSTKNFLRHESITSLRGAILDCHGKPLATNRPVTSLTWHGTGNKQFSDEQTMLLKALEFVTEGALSEIETNKELRQAERLSKEYVLLKDISFEQLSKIFEQIPHNENISITTSYTRLYPHGTCAAHVLGYFREHNDNKNRSGLEHLFEEQLRGVPGTLEKTIDSIGKNLKLREITKALQGKNIVTTLDFDLQSIAESIFPEGESGCFIIMDPHTGALRVCMSRPTFDPNIFLKPISDTEWKALQTNRPFHDRLSAEYPPASLCKIITTAAGLEEGIITTDKSWFCNGKIDFGDRCYLCHRHEFGGHGAVKNIEEALAYSCNIPFYEIGKRISIDTLASYAEKFGLGKKTGTILPEKKGLIPTTEWKRKTYGEPWWQGETLNCAIGQGPFLVTPLQMARMFGGICTGLLVKPRILEEEALEMQPLKISSHTLRFLRQSLRMTITTGTGSIMNKLQDITIHAKTGTAQTSHRSKRELGKEFLEHAWFVGFAYYKDYDPFVIVIFIENVGSAKFATRVAKKFFIEYCKLMDQKAAAA